MEMNPTECLAIKENLSETKQIAEELHLTLQQALLLRQLVALRWIVQTAADNLPAKK